MVPRCAYYLNENNDVVRHCVLIDWDLGFTKEAKHQYIMRLTDALNLSDKIIVDITSASYIYEARMLSPIFVKMLGSEDISVEDFLHKHNVWGKESTLTDEQKIALSGYVYLKNLSEENKRVIRKYDGFMDVFNNPITHAHNTQALFAALYKKIEIQKCEHILSSYEEYCRWYLTVEVEDIVIT